MSRRSTLKLFELARKSETIQRPQLLQPFQVSNYHLFFVCSANNRNNCHFHSKMVFQLFTQHVERCQCPGVDDERNTKNECKSKEKQFEFQILFFHKYYHIFTNLKKNLRLYLAFCLDKSIVP